MSEDYDGTLDLNERRDAHPEEFEPPTPRAPFINPRTGKQQTCRLDPVKLDEFYDDPMTRSYGVDTGEFVNGWRKQELADGCPHCQQEVTENASEPDVMARWDMR